MWRDSIDKISNEALRGNTLGALQANIGLWEILARQGQIPTADLNTSWQKMIDPFAKISSSTAALRRGTRISRRTPRSQQAATPNGPAR